MFTLEEIRKTEGKWNPDIHLFTMFLFGYIPVMNNIIEIGVATGGSAEVWRKFLSPEGKYIGIDINLHDPSQYLYAQMEEVKVKFKDDKRMHFIINDSTKRSTVEKVKEILQREPVDFLFIDGYHSTEVAKSDFDMYSPLVRSGGVVAFHDSTCNLNVKKAIDQIVDIQFLNADGSAGVLPAIQGQTGYPFKYVVRFDAKERHCGIIALVKE